MKSLNCNCEELSTDNDDILIKYICNSRHHPLCENFRIDKELFLQEFSRIVESKVSSKIESELIKIKNDILRNYSLRPPEKRQITSEKIIKKLQSWLSSRYFPIVSNIYIYDWESDLLAVNKESNYITEYEIKISRNDFKADFKKEYKHKLIYDCYRYNFSSDIPNYFYYATPPGLLNKSELPKYAGLIEVGLGNRIVKRAPLLHKDIISQLDIDKLLKKVYYKYWGLK